MLRVCGSCLAIILTRDIRAANTDIIPPLEMQPLQSHSLVPSVSGSGNRSNEFHVNHTLPKGSLRRGFASASDVKLSSDTFRADHIESPHEIPSWNLPNHSNEFVEELHDFISRLSTTGPSHQHSDELKNLISFSSCLMTSSKL